MERALETLVALAGLHLFLSLVATATVESISSLFDMRAKHFEKGVIALLGDKARDVLDSPLIKSLGRASGRKCELPSYVPPEIFSMAVIDVMRAKQGAHDLAALAKESGIPAIAAMVDQVGVDAAALRTRIEAWFDAGMQRLAGQFKRSIHSVTRIVVILLVLGLNADSLEVGRRLWSDPGVRQGALQYSQKLLEMCKEENGKLNCPSVAEGGAEAAAAYPLGWTWSKWEAMEDLGDRLNKLIGLLVTALAVSLGARFWFDVLRRLAPGLRQAGPKPDDTPTTRSGASDNGTSGSAAGRRKQPVLELSKSSLPRARFVVPGP